MPADATATSNRLTGALGALAVEGLLGWMLVAGLVVHRAAPRRAAMPVLAFPAAPPPPAEAAPKPKPARSKPEGAAAPPNRVSRAAEVAAPVRTPRPPPVAAAPVPATGRDPSSGAAALPGPGTGAGGAGSGTGSGEAGNGPGGGGGTSARWIRGSIGDADYPRAAARAGASGTVHLRFTVDVDGRVRDCAVTRSSGNAELDSTTCRLILKRFRYQPARDSEGRPRPDVVTGEHVWAIYGEGREGEDPADD